MGKRAVYVLLIVTVGASMWASVAHTQVRGGDVYLEWLGEWMVEGEPLLVAVDESTGDVLVNINHNWRVLRYSSQGELMAVYGRESEIPVGLAVDPEGNGVVAVNINHNWRIVKYGPDGDVLMEWEGDGEPRGLAVDAAGGIVVAVNINQNYRLVRYSDTGRQVASWDGEGEPMAIATDVEGQITIVASVNNMLHVVKHNSEGELLAQWTLVAGVIETNGIVVASGGEVFIAMTDSSRLAIYSTDGEHIGDFGCEGSEAGEFISPRGMAISQGGLLYVADAGNNRIQVFRLSY